MRPPDKPTTSSGSQRIDAFRGLRPQSPLRPAERRLLAVLGAHLCFLPWALGTMHVWSQGVSLALGVVGFGLALGSRPGPGRLAWTELRRFPFFWLGLALLAYVAIQGFNPWLRYVRNETSWWLVPASPVSWLPAGIEAPYEISNPWREFVIYATAWLVSCAAWVGLTRRRSWRILLAVLAANAVALGLLLALQRATGDTRLPWPLSELTDRAGLTASFVYKNHAGAYFGLMTFIAVSLATWGYDQGVRTMKKSTPAAALALVAAFLAVSVLFTLSRGATLILGGLLVGFVGWIYLRHRFRPSDTGTDSRITLVLALLFGAFVLFVGRSIDFSAINQRFDALIESRSKEYSVASRLEARSAGLALLADHGVRGIGAGGFRFIFPAYVQRYPDIYEGGKLFWEHVHCDWLEFPIELGVAGMLLLGAMAGYGVTLGYRCRAAWHSSTVPILLGCLGTLLHAWIEFPFQCPAILITWCLLLTLAGRSLLMETSRRS